MKAPKIEMRINLERLSDKLSDAQVALLIAANLFDFVDHKEAIALVTTEDGAERVMTALKARGFGDPPQQIVAPFIRAATTLTEGFCVALGHRDSPIMWMNIPSPTRPRAVADAAATVIEDRDGLRLLRASVQA